MFFRTHKRLKMILGSFLAVIVLAAAAIVYYLEFYTENISSRLPLTMEVQPNASQKTVGYQLWNAIISPYKILNGNPYKRITMAGYKQIQVLAGDDNNFAVGVTFTVQLTKGIWSTHHSWGKVGPHGVIQNIHWTLRIHKDGPNKYTLVQISPTESALDGLKPVKNEYQKKAGIPVPSTTHRYQIEQGQLQVTYDSGSHWVIVPASITNLFGGDYSGPKDTLISGSYIISPKRTDFVLVGRNSVNLLQSTDEGKNWTQVSMPHPVPGPRMRLLGFTSDEDGYLILSGNRDMAQEGTEVLRTTDGGKDWKVYSSPKTSNLLAAGGFVTKDLGFMSYNPVAPQGKPLQPELYRTDDGGRTWNPVQVPIPAQYQGVFTVAQTPTFDGQQGTLLVNQGPTGDYEGGKVMARFISTDDGLQWHFANLVDPANVLSQSQ